MRRTLIAVLGIAGVAGVLGACGDEDPTGVGSVLIGSGVTTYEVVLDPADFLLADTTYGGFGSIRDASFDLVANEFAGELDAHALVRLSRPFQVTYTPVDGTSQTDSLAAIRGAQFTIIVDTVASTPGPVALEVLPVSESWHEPTATWTLRSDTADAPEAWATPGGTTGPVVGMGIWQSGDTLVIEVDSADAAIWQDTAAARLGALIRTTTPGARLRFSSIGFSFDVVPRETPDTVLTAGSVVARTTLVFPEEPTAPSGTELRVGGLPVWRSLLQFQLLDDVVLDVCGGGIGPTGDPACDLPLRETSVTLAQLILEGRPVGGWRIERAVEIQPMRVLEAENVPVFRSPVTPLSNVAADGVADTVPVALFTPTPPPGVHASVLITNFVRSMVEGAPDGEDQPPPLQWLALLSARESAAGTFGYMSFGSMESAAPPRLRLVVTIPNEELFQ